MPGPVRKSISLKDAVKRLERLSSAEYYEACYQMLAVELRKSLRTRDWVLIAAVREVGFSRGILHQFLKAYDVVENSIAAGDVPPAVHLRVRTEEEYNANIKVRPDRIGEFEELMKEKPSPEDLKRFPLYYPGGSRFRDTPSLIERSKASTRGRRRRQAIASVMQGLANLGLLDDPSCAGEVERLQRRMMGAR